MSFVKPSGSGSYAQWRDLSGHIEPELALKQTLRLHAGRFPRSTQMYLQQERTLTTLLRQLCR